MTTSEETDWMNHPAIRALVDQANTLTLQERITLVKGLIPAIADALSEEEYERLWAEGQAMPLDEAVSYAFQKEPASPDIV
jgi:hypothetical protein